MVEFENFLRMFLMVHVHEQSINMLFHPSPLSAGVSESFK